MSENASQLSSSQIVTFEVEGETYGIDIMVLNEIIPMVELKLIPKAPEGIEGLINLRGTVIPVADLTKQFGFTRESYTTETRILVTELPYGQIGFIVDGVRDLKTFHLDKIHEPVIESKKFNFIEGIGKLETGEMVQIISLERVLNTETFEQLNVVKDQQS